MIAAWFWGAVATFIFWLATSFERREVGTWLAGCVFLAVTWPVSIPVAVWFFSHRNRGLS